MARKPARRVPPRPAADAAAAAAHRLPDRARRRAADVPDVYLVWAAIHFVDARVVPLIPSRYNPENVFGRNILGCRPRRLPRLHHPRRRLRQGFLRPDNRRDRRADGRTHADRPQRLQRHQADRRNAVQPVRHLASRRPASSSIRGAASGPSLSSPPKPAARSRRSSARATSSASSSRPHPIRPRASCSSCRDATSSRST